MAYTFSDPLAGLPAIGSIGSAAALPGGTIRRAYDPNYGEGEFIYLQGVANTVVGSCVTWSGISGGFPTFQTALSPAAGTNLNQPVAFATAAILAGQWGWYQIGGVAIAMTNGTFAAAGPAYLTATAGQISSTAVASRQVGEAYGLTAVGTPAANQILIELNRPCLQGAIT